MVNELLKRLSELSQVHAIALGGSRAGEVYDEKSDYDVYIYCNSFIEENIRRDILSDYCKTMEIGNHFWEYEDNCTLNNGIDIDVLYRNLDDLVNDIASVVEDFNPRNGYTTCMWHNLITCKIIYDEKGYLAKAKARFDIEYPEELKKSIIGRNMKLLHGSMPAYDGQIQKAIKRNDKVSINHRVAAFLESYFDVILAANKLTHPGEKRLVSFCVNNCKMLPNNFEKNLDTLFEDMFVNSEKVSDDIRNIVEELEKIL